MNPKCGARAKSFRNTNITCGICGGQSVTGEGFLRVHRFPPPILIHTTAPYSLSSYDRRYIVSLLTPSLNNKQTNPPQFHLILSTQNAQIETLQVCIGPLDKRLGGRHSRSRHYREETRFLPLSRIEDRFLEWGYIND
jgi:hypothetical protein